MDEMERLRGVSDVLMLHLTDTQLIMLALGVLLAIQSEDGRLSDELLRRGKA